MDLQINVAGLLKEHAGATRSVELDGPVLELEDGTQAHVSGRLRLTRTDRGVWLSGALDIGAPEMCSRCLVPFTQTVRVQVDDVFLPAVDIHTGSRLRPDELDEPDADTGSIDEHHMMELTEALRQYRLAALPMAPVCRQDCKGICPQCGEDRNQGGCTCEPEQDARWAKLRDLLK
ncbi:MAG: DUF177 domain-containing protein [Chloroflexota bacterium]